MGQPETKGKLVVVVPPRRARFARTRPKEPTPSVPPEKAEEGCVKGHRVRRRDNGENRIT